ncbi:FadR/GntR family transcriptional regulator [Streptomonospora nanhaiensis]|uniref:GntR family transcriptional repressor for pyruvate dehydrogenase complex n=1 Tax=Streptomonospora nanhaiensis TaxID=1323731 RepID=A0A853BWN4_9ACTN|nr:FadR/GntR family transcriptional regulator [Streptomonospora nanhaiensis]MBV2364487.1 FadR family transcriptional regulator [Streptomonospora nanhaiensis]NYI99165.1 GntR family transcriptional repressor for pyruvate dehydrogenase complex [Streptomonospora nanhaiensis]
MRPKPPRPRPLARPRLYEQLVERLCEYIREAELGPGDKLPPEREFAAALGVSRVSLGQALVALEVQGIIDVRHGDGAVVRYSPSDEEVLRVLRDRDNRRAEIIEARQALEVKLAELAARRRSRADIAEIDAALDLMRREIASGERGTTGDERFHSAVIRAARSGLLARMMDEIAPMILQTRMESLSQPGRPPASLAGHERIADAIRAGDAKAAGEAMRDHLEMVSDVAPLDD